MSERKRVAVCGGLGIVTFAVAMLFAPWQFAIPIGWIATASSLLVWIWSEVIGLDAQSTARVATREDDSRTAADVVLVGASVVSLAAVAIGLHRASTASQPLEALLTSASMLTVVLSWMTVQTLFMLRYAHLYYGGERVGGIEFGSAEPPDYHDFAYLAFTVGMTFQVSDTEVTQRAIRHAVLRHALLSYLFGVAIIASTISVLAGLVV